MNGNKKSDMGGKKVRVKINGKVEFEASKFAESVRVCRGIAEGNINSIMIVDSGCGMIVVYPTDKIEIEEVKNLWTSRR